MATSSQFQVTFYKWCLKQKSKNSFLLSNFMETMFLWSLNTADENPIHPQSWNKPGQLGSSGQKKDNFKK